MFTTLPALKSRIQAMQAALESAACYQQKWCCQTKLEELQALRSIEEEKS